MPAKRYVCIHGHFYQPPRENAWLEVIELQDSAHPYHDWNERISAECYAPNAASRILDEDEVIRKIQNNYAHMSFNFGPTLLSWMEVNDPETYQAILDADKESMEHFGGHGSAMAQVYNHIIMPLANLRDKETQVIWGIRDFEHRFKRMPKGMWLAETAVDTETLEVLAKHGIEFTVLAPRQAKAIKPAGATEWKEINEGTLNTRKAYTCKLPSGKSISIIYYDGNTSQSIAFNGLLYDGKNFAERLQGSFDENDEEAQLVNVATDGETYGHHHKHGDMALAYCFDYIRKGDKAEMTNYAQFLALFPPMEETQIHENTSWSCYHGVERWRSNCGCHSGGKPEWNQAWRKPLRESLDWLRDELADIFSREASKFLKDPWAARNDYVKIVVKRSDASIKRFLKEHAVGTLDELLINKTLRLLELQRHCMLMYTSCGWFFDEVSGIETIQIMQYACRAIQLSRQLTDVDLEAGFLDRLSQAMSNVQSMGTAADVYRRVILPSKGNLHRVGVHYAVSSVFEEEPELLPLFNYQAHNEAFVRKEAGEQRLVMGITRIHSLVTHSEKIFSFAVIYLGKHNLICHLSLDGDRDKFTSMQMRLVTAFSEGRLGDLLELMNTYFGPDKYTIWHLFQDEKRKVLDMIARQSLGELEDSLRRTYNRDYPLVNALSNNEVPIPKAYKTTFEYILNADLVKCFTPEKINIRALERITGEMERWNLKVEDSDKLARLAGESIFKELKRISNERQNAKRIHRLNRVFPLLVKFNIEPNLHYSQNLYFEISQETQEKGGQAFDNEWVEHFKLLGENLGLKVESV
jgi:alpha-amylase/alpha-mannosidase (GH57 family)